MLPFLFQAAAGAVSLYTTLCIIRIIITWFPQINYSAFGRFLGALCDPYLNLFGRIPLRLGAFDFTPMLAIGALSVLSSVLGTHLFRRNPCIFVDDAVVYSVFRSRIHTYYANRAAHSFNFL